MVIAMRASSEIRVIKFAWEFVSSNSRGLPEGEAALIRRFGDARGVHFDRFEKSIVNDAITLAESIGGNRNSHMCEIRAIDYLRGKIAEARRFYKSNNKLNKKA